MLQNISLAICGISLTSLYFMYIVQTLMAIHISININSFSLIQYYFLFVIFLSIQSFFVGLQWPINPKINEILLVKSVWCQKPFQKIKQTVFLRKDLNII